MVHSGAARAAVENMSGHSRSSGPATGEALRPRCRPVRHRDAADQVSARLCREDRRHGALGRLGTEEEWAWLVAYLASPAGDFFSGTTITMDGARDDWFGPWPPPSLTERTGEDTIPAEERKPRD